METIQPKPAVAKQTKKQPRKEVVLLVVAAISTVADIALDIAVGADKSSPLGITGDVFHIISIVAILSLFFINGTWNRLSKIQKPFATIACVGYSLGAIEELMRHATGIDSFMLVGLVGNLVGIASLIAVVAIGIFKKSQR